MPWWWLNWSVMLVFVGGVYKIAFINKYIIVVHQSSQSSRERERERERETDTV